jgi:hypothetical protein
VPCRKSRPRAHVFLPVAGTFASTCRERQTRSGDTSSRKASVTVRSVWRSVCDTPRRPTSALTQMWGRSAAALPMLALGLHNPLHCQSAVLALRCEQSRGAASNRAIRARRFVALSQVSERLKWFARLCVGRPSVGPTIHAANLNRRLRSTSVDIRTLEAAWGCARATGRVIGSRSRGVCGFSRLTVSAGRFKLACAISSV